MSRANYAANRDARLAPEEQTIASLPPGLYDAIPHATYHQREKGVVSVGALQHFARAPLVYRTWLDGAEDKDTPAFAFGRALHMAVLEPDLYEQTYVVAPNFGDCRRRENKLARDAWRNENLGRQAITFEDARSIEAMCGAARRHPLAARLLDGGLREGTLRWDSPEGLASKCRPDLYREDFAVVVDIKTCEDATPEGFRKTCARYGYHLTAAHYSEGFASLGIPLDSYLFLAMEKEPPYLCGLYALHDDALRKGSDRLARLRSGLADCLARDSWPGLPESILTIDLPPWAA